MFVKFVEKSCPSETLNRDLRATIQQLGGHVRMAHPKKRGRKTKERALLDYLNALVKGDKTNQKTTEDIIKWAVKNGYKPLINFVLGFRSKNFTKEFIWESKGGDKIKIWTTNYIYQILCKANELNYMYYMNQTIAVARILNMLGLCKYEINYAKQK